MKLLASLASPFTRKVRVVLAEKKIDFEMELVDVQPVDTPVNRHNPLGKIPTLVLEDGTALYDSRVIVEFLDNASPFSRLIPGDIRERVQVRRWEALADGVVDAGILVRYEAMRDEKEQSKAWRDKQVARMQRGMAQMAAEIEGRTCCHGDRYSLADIAVGCCVGWLGFRKPGDIDWQVQYPALARHHQKLMERAAFSETVPQLPK
jgi:glutathione S-transferase